MRSQDGTPDCVQEQSVSIREADLGKSGSAISQRKGQTLAERGHLSVENIENPLHPKSVCALRKERNAEIRKLVIFQTRAFRKLVIFQTRACVDSFREQDTSEILTQSCMEGPGN